jgi:4-hydroxy 2-oxovalerate aldolase
MAISTVKEAEIDPCWRSPARPPPRWSWWWTATAALYREQVDHLVRKYLKALHGTGKEVGMHAHNNLQLAFANTIEAIILGCNRVDSTMLGLGRGAGNCHTEILLGFLRNPKFKLRPVLQADPATPSCPSSSSWIGAPPFPTT